MSGHSKWATIKRKKGAIDAKRGKLFTKIIREITVAARHGGGSPDSNPRLRVAMDKARGVNMPNDNIKRAISRGTGASGEQFQIEEVVYEGYGPGGAAIMVEAMTDNKNRTSAELRTIFTRLGGSLGAPGCVAWIFNSAGIISFDKGRFDEETLMEAALEAGAADFRSTDSGYEVITSPETLDAVKNSLLANKLEPNSAEIVKNPKTTVPIDGKNAEHMLKLMDALEEHEDVQEVYSNFDIPEKLIESLVGSESGQGG